MRIIIRPHSFIDVITNSSSELFVARSDAQIDVVIAFIQEYLEGDEDAPTSDITEYIEKIYRIEGDKQAELMRIDNAKVGDIIVETYDYNNGDGYEIPAKLVKKLTKKFNIIIHERSR